MIHKDLLTQPKRIKKEKKKDGSVNSGYISESTDRCNERQNWQTSDGWYRDSHHKNEKKNKKKHYEAEECKRKSILEGPELLDTKRRKKDKHEKMQ
jgi:hypothetical protein